LQQLGLSYETLNNLTSINVFDEVIARGVYLFVKIDAVWCEPCRSLEPVIRQLSTEYTDILFIKINFDTFKAIARQYAVKSIPTVLLFNDNSLVHRATGNQPKSYWVSLIKSSF